MLKPTSCQEITLSMYIDFITEIISGLVIFWQKVSFNIDMVYKTIFDTFFRKSNISQV